MTALETARPTLRSSGSLTVRRHSATASSLVARVGLVGAHQRVVTLAKSSGRVRAGHPERVLHQLGLGLDVEAGEGDVDVVAEPAELVHGHLEGRRRRLAPGAADAHPVAPGLLER